MEPPWQEKYSPCGRKILRAIPTTPNDPVEVRSLPQLYCTSNLFILVCLGRISSSGFLVSSVLQLYSAFLFCSFRLKTEI